jgi:uncharacterized protein with von Willebrand factor type A (vWA) domain
MRAATDPHLVESDLYDRAAIARLRVESKAWRKLGEEGERLLPHFEALLDDLFCVLFKYNILWAEECPASAELNRRILEAMLAGPAYAALRAATLLDESRAGLATVLIGEALLRALREDRVLTSGDILDLWSLKREEERAAEAADAAQTGEEISAPVRQRRAVRGGRPTKGEQALHDAVRSARESSRAAEAEREQKRRHVQDDLERVRASLEKRVLGAAALAALRVQDAGESIAAWSRAVGGAGGRQSAGQSIDLGRRLADNKKLRRLAQLVGRMREAALAVRRRVIDRADEEIYEVGLSSGLESLARLVPHELLALSHPLLRQDLRRRLLDGGLLTYALRGNDSRGRGPLVVCLDTSSSMAGEKEVWAKAVALTFLEIARRQRRRCHVICFSSGPAELKEFDLNPRAPYEVAIERTFDLAEYFPGGGTDFMLPLDAALERLKARAMKRGDIVLITDGECQVEAAWQERFLRAKKNMNFSLYSILIDVGSAQSETVAAIADRISLVRDLTADHRQLFTDLPRRPGARRRTA